MDRRAAGSVGAVLPAHFLAEDDSLNRTMMTQLSPKMSHEGDMATSGGEMLEVLQDDFCDVVLMDVQMLKMNEPEATCRIWDEGPAARWLYIVMPPSR